MNIIIINLVVKIDIVQIYMFFIEETTYLNFGNFNEQTGYHFLPEFGLKSPQMLKSTVASYEFETKQINRILTKKLKSILRVALERPLKIIIKTLMKP